MRCPQAIALAAVLAMWLTAPAIAQAPAPAEPPATQAPSQADPPPPPPQPSPRPPAAKPGDPFGEEVTLAAKTIVFMKGSGVWDTAYETLIDAFKSVYAYIDKNGLKRAGPAMTIYTSADDTGFNFQAAVPIEAVPSDPPRGDIEVGQSPSGRALKFMHRGSYDSMDSTYEAITNHLDEKRLEAQDLFVEEYETDPVTTPENDLVVTVYVPVR